MHATLCDLIADTAQNSLEAGAHHVSVSLTEDDSYVSVLVSDDGKGMDAAILARAFDPFYSEPGKHAARRVGLGLPILKQMCEACAGDVSLNSEKGRGTVLKYRLAANHVDLPPMGNVAQMVLTLFNYPGDFDLTFTHTRAGESYTIARSELAEAVGDLESVEGLSLAKEFLESQEQDLPQFEAIHSSPNPQIQS